MTRQLVWKEVREQAAVLIALLALGAGVLAATAILLDSPTENHGLSIRTFAPPGRLALVMLTLTAGVVVGGTLFAGEREAGTFTFLDQLPASRWAVFWRKVATGAVLTAGAAVGLWVAAVAARLLGPATALPGWAIVVGLVAAVGFGWGVLGSVRARNSLAACGLGLLWATAAAGVLLPLTAATLSFSRSYYRFPLVAPGDVWGTAALVAGWGLLALPLPAAWWLYTAPDRSRLTGLGMPSLAGLGGVRWLPALPDPRFGASARRLVWLFARQHRVVALALPAVGLVAGGVLLLPDAPAVAIWPVLSLLVGVLVGVVTVADEQQSGAGRFWGERRLPAGRLWLAKVTLGLLLTVAVCVCLLVPATVAALVQRPRFRLDMPVVAAVLRSGVLAEHEFPIRTFLLTWPVYGFAFAHLAGLLFRKALVAGAVGTLLGGTFAAVWLPSLLSGGLHPWQVFAPAAAALLTARFLTWPWATDRLGTRPALRRLAVGTVAVIAAAGVGIGYRVAEVPALATDGDHLAFAATLPTLDDQQAGRVVRRAIGLLEERKPLLAEKADRPVVPELPPATRQLLGLPATEVRPPADRRYVEQCWQVIRAGYPANRPDLGRWLAAATAANVDGVSWEQVLAEAAAKPTGVLEDPNELTVTSELRFIPLLHRLGGVYLARGLLAQQEGDPADFARRLPVWLATLRTARNKTIARVQVIGYMSERAGYQAVDRWLERLDGRPDLLRAALAAVVAHDAADGYDPGQVRLAEQVVAWNALTSPGLWLPKYLDTVRSGGAIGPDKIGYSRTAEMEAELVAFAWAVPWERERLRRVHGLGNTGEVVADQAALARGAPGWYLTTAHRYADQSVRTWRTTALVERHAAILKLAVRLYYDETGQFPVTLDALAPKYVPPGLARSLGRAEFEYRLWGDKLAVEQDGWQAERVVRGQPVVIARVSNWVTPRGRAATAVPGSSGIEGDDWTGAILFAVPLPPNPSSKQ